MHVAGHTRLGRLAPPGTRPTRACGVLRAGRGRWLALAICGVVHSACDRTVVLGSECPEQDLDSPCELTKLDARVVASDRAPSADEDAQARDEEDAELDGARDGETKVLPEDGGTSAPNDAEPDAAPLVQLKVDNGSFERGGGLPGDVLLSNLVSTLLPIQPVTWVWTELAGWYACLPLSVRSETRDLGGDAGAYPMGADYVSFVVNGTSVRQTLPAPMKKGARYAFEVDVNSFSEGANNLFLEVRGARQQCGEGAVLGRTALVADAAGWSTACVSFEASDAYGYLLLAPGFEGGTQPSGNARMWIDDLRQVESCPQ